MGEECQLLWTTYAGRLSILTFGGIGSRIWPHEIVASFRETVKTEDVSHYLPIHWSEVPGTYLLYV